MASNFMDIQSGSTYDSIFEPDKSPDSLPSVAVVGLSIRFPDEATSLDSFWDMLIHARCASREFPPDRMNIDAFHHPNGEISGSVSWHILHIIFLQDFWRLTIVQQSCHYAADIFSVRTLPPSTHLFSL